MTKPTVERTRNYGVDLLKLLSMGMIVTLHVLGQGGILAGLEVFSPAYEMAWLLEIACFGAVNCFALATGYLTCTSRFRYSRLMELWLQVACYTIGFSLLFHILWPGTLTEADWKLAFFPVSTGQYWYFTAYFALYLFTPFINKMLDTLSRSEMQRLVASFLLLVLLTLLARDDIFRMHGGYTVIWLTGLYFIGAYFKKFPLSKPIGSRFWLLGYLLMILATWASKWLLQKRALALYGEAGEGNLLVSYISPTILLGSIFLFLACVHLQIGKESCRRLLSRWAPASFGVYLIHCQVLIWHRVLAGRFAPAAQLSFWLLPPAVMAISLGIEAVCLVIDRIRMAVFKGLGISGICARLEEGAAALLGRIIH